MEPILAQEYNDDKQIADILCNKDSLDLIKTCINDNDTEYYALGASKTLKIVQLLRTSRNLESKKRAISDEENKVAAKKQQILNEEKSVNTQLSNLKSVSLSKSVANPDACIKSTQFSSREDFSRKIMEMFNIDPSEKNTASLKKELKTSSKTIDRALSDLVKDGKLNVNLKAKNNYFTLPSGK